MGRDRQDNTVRSLSASDFDLSGESIHANGQLGRVPTLQDVGRLITKGHHDIWQLKELDDGHAKAFLTQLKKPNYGVLLVQALYKLRSSTSKPPNCAVMFQSNGNEEAQVVARTKEAFKLFNLLMKRENLLLEAERAVLEESPDSWVSFHDKATDGTHIGFCLLTDSSRIVVEEFKPKSKGKSRKKSDGAASPTRFVAQRLHRDPTASKRQSTALEVESDRVREILRELRAKGAG